MCPDYRVTSLSTIFGGHAPMHNNQVEKAAPVQIVDTGSANDHGRRLIDGTARRFHMR